MNTASSPLFALGLLALMPFWTSIAQDQQRSSDVPTFRANSSLVFLDVTVLDKKNRPIVKGLTKDDFIITEDKNPRRIFSFEPPETHLIPAGQADNNPKGKAPVTIFVLDQLNSSFNEFAITRYLVRRYLSAQPAQLHAPAELMVIGNQSLELLQGSTRSRQDLLDALDHLPASIPYKLMTFGFFAERFVQSIEALQQIALMNQGVPGRKNVVWVGPGAPGLMLTGMTGKAEFRLQQILHSTTNMLVDARMSLFVINPGLKTDNISADRDSGNLDVLKSVSNYDPFGGDINFAAFVSETGGNLFYNRNDFDGEMKRSQELGTRYYTLTYQPAAVSADGKFRQVRVTLRDPNLLAVTKTGFFAPDASAAADPRRQSIINLAEASRSTVPFTALDMKVSGVVRHPDSGSADITVELKGKNVLWLPADNGKSTTSLIVASTSLSGRREILASKVENLIFSAATQDPVRLTRQLTRLTVTLQVPRKTKSIRVVVETEQGGQIGTTEVDRPTLDAAPVRTTPAPHVGPES